jgi:hypothetical protein
MKVALRPQATPFGTLGRLWTTVYLCDYAAQPPFRRTINRPASGPRVYSSIDQAPLTLIKAAPVEILQAIRRAYSRGPIRSDAMASPLAGDTRLYGSRDPVSGRTVNVEAVYVLSSSVGTRQIRRY